MDSSQVATSSCMGPQLASYPHKKDSSKWTEDSKDRREALKEEWTGHNFPREIIRESA